MSYIHPRVRYTRPEDERKNSVIRYISTRVLRYNRNFLCAVTGQTGSGKSWACGSMAEIYSRMSGVPYIPEKHTFFSLKDLITIINNKEEHEVRFGTPLVYDEAQVEANARNWQSEANRILSMLVSTFRNQRLVLFFPTPVLEYLDRQSRILFHAEFMIKGYDINSKMTKVKPRFLEYNKKMDDFYRKRLIVEYRRPNKNVYSKYYVQDWEIPAPSKEWIKIYEKMKLEFTDKLNKELLAKINKQEEKERDKSQDFFDVAKLYEEFGQDYKRILSQLPHLTPHTIEKYILFLKRGNKEMLRAA